MESCLIEDASFFIFSTNVKLKNKHFPLFQGLYSSREKSRHIFKEKNMKTVLPILILLLGIGGFLCGKAYSRFQKSSESHSWQSADALITKSEYKKRRTGDVTVINYTYTVSQKEYTGENVTLDGQDNAKDDAINYPVGKKLKAYYNPENPNEAVLVQGYGPWETWFTMIAGAVFFLIPGLIMLGWLLLSLLPLKKMKDSVKKA